MDYCCNTFLKAVKNKHIDCLIHANIYCVDYYDKNLNLCSICAYNNDTDSLIYLTSRFETDLSEDVCKYAVLGNSVECLTVAHSNGYSIDDEILVIICTIKGYYDCLVYLIKNGVTCPKEICNYAIANDSLSCLLFLLRKGYNFSEVTLALAYFMHGEESLCYLLLKSQSNFDIENYDKSMIETIDFTEINNIIADFKNLLFYEERCGR